MVMTAGMVMTEGKYQPCFVLLLNLWFPQLPPNGLVVYTGMVMTEEGKEKKVNIDFEPFKPINTSLYMCDNKFHTAALSELLESDNK